MARADSLHQIATVGRQEGSPARYHALDGLRAAMMLLGIYLHVAVAYSTIGGWPYKQAALSATLNPTIVLIHVFRMPIFYLMAGFFAALLYQRRGLRGAAANRLLRIAVPFAVGWAILFPVVALLVGPARFGWAATLAAFRTGEILSYAEPMHLWFLEYLLVLYALAAVAAPALAALPERWRARFNHGFRRVVGAPWGPVLLAVPSFFALLPMRFAGFDDPTSFIPAPHIVIAYAIPFGFGWLLYLNADLLDGIRARAWTHALWAVLLAGAFLGMASLFVAGVIARPPRGSWLFLAFRAQHSLALWFLMFGLVGLFLRYLDRYSARWRYLCDSSYFLYLAHMPAVLGFQLLVEPLAWPPLLKVPVVLAGATLALLTIYRYAVRPTAIGAVLNGRRHPAGSSLPLAEPARGHAG